MRQRGFCAKLISLILALMLIVGIMPSAALAQDHDGQVRVVVRNDVYPVADGAPWDGLLVDTWVKIDESSSMMSCLVAALDTVGATQTGAENNYVSEINGLTAGSYNGMDGWMGTLNDWMVNEGFGAFTVADGKLAAGDEINIAYSLEYGEDLGASWGNNNKTVKALSVSAGSLSPEFSADVHEYTLAVPEGTTSVKVVPTAFNKNFQVRASIGETEYKRNDDIPVTDGTVITVKCGDPSWPTMNGGSYGDADSVPAESYTLTVKEQKQSQSDITIYATVSYKAGIAMAADGTVMANVPVKVSATDGKATVDEALKSLHAAYCENGYASEKTQYGLSIKRAWGVDTGAVLNYINNVGILSDVGTDTVSDGDYLNMCVMTDTAGYSDSYTHFDKHAAQVATGEQLELTLSYQSFDSSWNTVTNPLAGAKIVVNDAETDVVTDKDGKATISFKRAGTYYVSAAAPDGMVILAPACVVTVAGNARPTLKEGVNETDAKSIALGETFAIDLSEIFEDADADELKYSVSIDGGAFTEAQKDYTYTPETAGSTTLVFSANDGQDDADKTYIVVLNAEQSYSALASLIIHTGTSPADSNVLVKNASDTYANGVIFDPEKLSYDLTALTDGVSQLRFRALPQEDGAKVTLSYFNGGSKDITWKSGSSKWANCITAGKNALKITVTPPAGSNRSEQVYTFNIDCIPTLKELGASANGTALYLDKDFDGAVNDYTLTVPENASEIELNAAGKSDSYKLEYDGADSSKVDITGKDGFTVTVIAGEGENALKNTYNIAIKRVGVLDFKINAKPADAIVKVYDKKGASVEPNEDGSFSGMFSSGGYTYVVSRYGYVTNTGDVPTTGGALNIELIKAEKGPDEVDAYWPSFRGNNNNMGLTSAATPTEAEYTELIWNKKLGSGWSASPSVQIVVDDTLIVMSSKSIFKLDLETGGILAEGTMTAQPNFGYTPPMYAEGMIFAPLSGGIIQAFDAKTLKSLWIYKDPLGGQSLSPISYSDGYIYTGFWNSETKDANFICLSVTDEDVTKGDESKLAVWRETHAGGYYFAGSVTIGNAVIVGADDGTSGADGASTITSYNKLTGKVISRLKITGDQRSTIAYDETSGRIYFTTKCGYLYSAAINAATGEITDLKAKKYDGKQSTSTPVIYKGRVYFATGTGISSSGSGGEIVVADAATLEPIYSVGLKGYPQCSLLISNAYEQKTGYIYVYSTYNNNPGGISVLKVKPDAKSADEAQLSELYGAAGFENYCIASIICSKDGKLYYKNDTGNVLAVGIPKAKSVMKLISEIGDVTLDSEDAITIARNAYNALTEDEKAKVENYDVLVAAEKRFDELKAQSVDELIDEIGNVTMGSVSKIEAARSAYDALTDAQKKLVKKYDKLTAAEAKYAEMVSCIENVKKLIDKIGTVKNDAATKKRISDARKAYDKLGGALKKHVINYNKLTAAEKKLAQLENAAKVEELIDAIGEVTKDGEKAVKKARSAYNALTDAEKMLVKNYSKLTEAERKLSSLDANGSTKVIGDGDTEVTVGGVKYKVDAEAAALMKTIEKLTHASEPAEQEVIDAYKAYADMDAKLKAQIFNYDDLKALTNALGVKNHETDIAKIDGLDWFIRLEVTELKDSDEYDKLASGIGANELIGAWSIKLIDTLTGEEFVPDTELKLMIKAPSAEGYAETRIASLANGGRVEYYDCVIEGEYVAFEAKEFAHCAYIGNKGKAKDALTDDGDVTISTRPQETGQSGGQLMWLWILLAAVGAAAIIIVIVMRKKLKKD